MHRADTSEGPVASGGDPPLDVEEVAAHLTSKFEWLADADVTAACEQLEAIFAEREIRVIAPGHGCVIAGRDAVLRHYKLTLEALQSVSNTSLLKQHL